MPWIVLLAFCVGWLLFGAILLRGPCAFHYVNIMGVR